MVPRKDQSGRRCRSRRTCPQCHSSHPSNLNRRQNCQNVHGIQGSFRSDTKTRAKNIGVPRRSGSRLGTCSSSPLMPLSFSHTRYRAQQSAEINTALSKDNSLNSAGPSAAGLLLTATLERVRVNAAESKSGTPVTKSSPARTQTARRTKSGSCSSPSGGSSGRVNLPEDPGELGGGQRLGLGSHTRFFCVAVQRRQDPCSSTGLQAAAADALLPCTETGGAAPGGN